MAEQPPPAAANRSLDPPIRIRVLPPGDAEQVEVLHWLLPEAPPAAGLDPSPHRLAAGMAEPAVIVQALCGERPCGAMLAVLRPDGSAEGIPPRVAGPDGSRITALLLQALGEELRRRGATLLVIYLPLEDRERLEWLCAAGCRRTHDLLILTADTRGAAAPAVPPEWQILPYRRRDRTVLEGVVEASFNGARDFPDLDPGTGAGAILNRFQETGVSGTRIWYLVRHRGRWAGCLLLADHPDGNRCELVYMGLVPAARGQRGGLLMARYACSVARRIGRDGLVLGVDAENDPAVAVYAAAGCVQSGRRAVLFRRLMLASSQDLQGPTFASC